MRTQSAPPDCWVSATATGPEERRSGITQEELKLSSNKLIDLSHGFKFLNISVGSISFPCWYRSKPVSVFLLLSALCTLWGRKLKEKKCKYGFKSCMCHLVPFKIESRLLRTRIASWKIAVLWWNLSVSFILLPFKNVYESCKSFRTKNWKWYHYTVI